MRDISKLPKKEQRIIIAKDVLAQIKLGKYIPQHLNYISFPNDESSLDWDESFQKVLPNIKQCAVCALGSAMCSIAKFKNNISVSEIYDSLNDKWGKLLLSVFSKTDLSIMESCFEGGREDFIYSLEGERVGDYRQVLLSNNQYEETIKFHNYFKNAEERLTAIMKHIIKNKGVILLRNCS